MKQWYRALPTKIICFILCIVSLAVVAASIVGAALFFEFGFYTAPEDRVRESLVYDKVYSDGYGIAYRVMCELNASDVMYHYSIPADYSADGTNIRFRIFSPEGHVLETNEGKSNVSWDYSIPYLVKNDPDGFLYITPIEEGQAYDNEEVYCIKLSLAEELPVNDEYAMMLGLIDAAYDLLYWIYPIGIAALLLFVTCLCMLIAASARRRGSEELHPGALNRVPIDLLIAAAAFAFILALELIVYVWYTGELVMHVLIGIWIVLAVCTLLGLVMSVSARIKQRNLLTNTVVWQACRLLWFVARRTARAMASLCRSIAEFVRRIPMIWRTLAVVLFAVFLDYVILILVYDWEWEFAILICVLKDLAFIAAALYGAWFMRKLQRGGRAIAKGELSYKVDTKGMFWDFKRHGEDLNSISDGMAAAVDERLKSERMKTELITNVSHDIKTPLTSIINYSTLIHDEDDAEKCREYSEVLLRKSEHLKRLLDDLVEVSKANTGNLDVALEPCEAGVLLSQVSGEFEERCHEAGLTLVTTCPENGISIMADSRRIWRVFENLMHNACKYSLSGSRVYLSLESADGEAVFTFRNTSAAPLNISPDELMERFVRGDSSRTTEGSGLGLSIARSLTELQGGRMDITIDGDLFKVTLCFPLI